MVAPAPGIAPIGSLADAYGETIRESLGWVLTPAAARLAALTALVVVVLIRRHRTRRALTPAERVRFDVRPTDTFDPGPEEIDRYAAQLARTRRAVRRGTSRSAHAVRIRLDAGGDGTVHYRVEGHRRAASILAVPGFHEVELTPDTPDPAAATTPPSSDHPAASPPAGQEVAP